MALANANIKEIHQEIAFSDLQSDDIIAVYRQSTGQTGGLLGGDFQIGDSSLFEWSGTVEYVLNEVVTYQGQWWQSLQNANEGNIPTEGVWWTQINKISGVIIPFWQAGLFTEHLILQRVDTAIYGLKNTVTLPFISVLSPELDLANWELVGGGGGGDSFQYKSLLSSDTANTQHIEIQTTSISGLFDAFFVADGFAGDGFIEWEAKFAKSTNYVLGLDPTFTNIDRNIIDYGIQLDNTNMSIKESGVSTFIGVYNVGDTFKIERLGTDIKYYQNGGLVHTTGGAPVTLHNIAYNCANAVNPPQEIILNLSLDGILINEFIDDQNVLMTRFPTDSNIGLLVGPTSVDSANPLQDPKTSLVEYRVDYGAGFVTPGSGSLADFASSITANLLLAGDKGRFFIKATPILGFEGEMVNGFYYERL